MNILNSILRFIGSVFVAIFVAPPTFLTKALIEWRDKFSFAYNAPILPFVTIAIAVIAWIYQVPTYVLFIAVVVAILITVDYLIRQVM